MVFALAPPPVLELGTISGFDFYLKDLTTGGHDALTAARNQLLALAGAEHSCSRTCARTARKTRRSSASTSTCRRPAPSASPSTTSTRRCRWRGAAATSMTSSTAGGSSACIVQADAPFRMAPEDFDRWYVRNRSGEMVPFTAFATSHWRRRSPRLERYNGAPAMQDHRRGARRGVSSGDAMAEIEQLVAAAAAGLRHRVERAVVPGARRRAAQTPLLYTLSLIVVFLCLAALYESWSIPDRGADGVPLGVLGAVLATVLRGLRTRRLLPGRPC